MRPFLYAFRRRCPRCGGGPLFNGWFRMEPACPRCGLDFERNPGAFIGGVGLNTVITFVAVAVAIGFAFWWTDSDRTVLSVLLGPMLLALVLPLAFFPFSKTLWLAVELIATPPDDVESGAADPTETKGA